MRTPTLCLALTIAAAAGMPSIGCSSAGIAVREKLGFPKRDQLVNRVQEARDEQQQAKQQFSDALQQFLAITATSGGDLETKYNQLKKEYDRSETRATAVHDRVQAVENVAEALFKEWKGELNQYSNASLRQASAKELDDTRARYDKLIGAMKAAESKMTPVLSAFKDQVLFLKHNLNARAIASLQTSVDQIQSDVGRLIDDMNASITEANTFIDQMKATK